MLQPASYEQTVRARYDRLSSHRSRAVFRNNVMHLSHTRYCSAEIHIETYSDSSVLKIKHRVLEYDYKTCGV